MKTSTMKDITDRLEVLKEIAKQYAEVGLVAGDTDTWDSPIIDNMYFDFNIFMWEDENGEDKLHVTVHPVDIDNSGNATTDMSNFLRLVGTGC